MTPQYALTAPQGPADRPTRPRRDATPKRIRIPLLFGIVAALCLGACGGSSSGPEPETAVGETTAPPATADTGMTEREGAHVPNASAAEGQQVGFEILEILGDGTIRAWIALDMTQEEFRRLDLPTGWLKNQPRQGQPDVSTFHGSPGADGDLTEAEHFGYDWFHSATITSTGEGLDDEGLLRATTLEKEHEIGFHPGSTLTLLVSPGGHTYVMVSRDADRTTDEPTLPAGWEIVEQVVSDGYTARLGGETTVIRTDNEDSYQGPITSLDRAASAAANQPDAAGPTRPRSESSDSPAILSAYLGAVDIPPFLVGPMEDVSGCDQKPGDEGLPIVLSHPVDANTLSTSDFVVTTAAGHTATPTCATLEPATEDGELQTVLLTGPMGTDDDRPTRVSIVGELRATDGTELSGLETDRLSTFENGPSIVLARLDPAGEACASLGSTHEIQTTWDGGVTGWRNTEPGPTELEGFTLLDTNGEAHALLGFDDLGDSDNHLVVCVPPKVEPATLAVRPGTVFDPTNNPNPATSAPVVWRR